MKDKEQKTECPVDILDAMRKKQRIQIIKQSQHVAKISVEWQTIASAWEYSGFAFGFFARDIPTKTHTCNFNF